VIRVPHSTPVLQTRVHDLTHQPGSFQFAHGSQACDVVAFDIESCEYNAESLISIAKCLLLKDFINPKKSFWGTTATGCYLNCITLIILPGNRVCTQLLTTSNYSERVKFVKKAKHGKKVGTLSGTCLGPERTCAPKVRLTGSISRKVRFALWTLLHRPLAPKRTKKLLEEATEHSLSRFDPHTFGFKGNTPSTT